MCGYPRQFLTGKKILITIHVLPLGLNPYNDKISRIRKLGRAKECRHIARPAGWDGAPTNSKYLHGTRTSCNAGSGGRRMRPSPARGFPSTGSPGSQITYEVKKCKPRPVGYRLSASDPGSGQEWIPGIQYSRGYSRAAIPCFLSAGRIQKHH